MTVSRSLLALLGAAATIGCTGCGTSSAPASKPSYVIERVSGSPRRQIVLSPEAVREIGIKTERAAAGRARRAAVTIPYSAIVYDASGRSYAFVSPGPFAYREVPIRVRTIVGPIAYLVSGPRPGARIVTVGAEELFGVQTGVLGQT